LGQIECFLVIQSKVGAHGYALDHRLPDGELWLWKAQDEIHAPDDRRPSRAMSLTIQIVGTVVRSRSRFVNTLLPRLPKVPPSSRSKRRSSASSTTTIDLRAIRHPSATETPSGRQLQRRPASRWRSYDDTDLSPSMEESHAEKEHSSSQSLD
jgi:hypothetical protein